MSAFDFEPVKPSGNGSGDPGSRGRPASPGSIVPRRCTLDGFALEPGCVEGVALQSLDAGSVLVVNTRNSHYRLVVLDGVRQRVLVEGGRLFPEVTEVRLEGATAGGSMLRTGWIGVGLRLEMSVGTRRIVSSHVRSVTIEASHPD